jgi:hypothetical protein
MSGESSREEKVEVRNGRAGAVRPYQTENTDETAMPTAVRQASRQQLIVCDALGQHDFWDASECEMAADWQSVDITEEVAANATRELCRPMASITIIAMS